jgi:MATE family multidrug resistance protein
MNIRLYLQETKNTGRLALPLIATNLVQASSGFIGTAFLARLGTQPLAASGLVSSLYFMLIVVFWGMLSSIAVLIAQAHGAKQPDKIKRLMQQGLFFAGLLTLPMMFVMWFVPNLLEFSVKDPAVLALATQYLHAMVWIVVPGTSLVLMEQLLIGLQKSTAVMLFSLLSVPLEIAASYALIFGKFGLPAYGIAGIGYGLAFAYTILTIAMAFYIHYQKDLSQYHVFKALPRLDTKLLQEIIRIGWPIGAMYGIEVSLFAALALTMGKLGPIALDAHQIVMQYMGLEIMVTFALMNATSIRVSHAIGRQDYSRLACIGHVGMFLAGLIALLVAIVYVALPHWIVSLDVQPGQINSEAIYLLTAKLLQIAAIYQIAEAVRIVAMGALRGMKDTRYPMINSLISFWLIGFSLSYLLGIWLNGQAVGLWLGVTLGIIVGAVVLVARYQRFAVAYQSGIRKP